MFKTILVPVDPAEPEFAAQALEHAIGQAKQADGKVRLLAVAPIMTAYVSEFVPAEYQREMAREVGDKLQAMAQKAGGAGCPVECVIRLGNVYTEVIEEAKQWGADLIVVSSHQPALSTYFIGSNAAQIVRHASCSVLVLRE